MLHPHLPVPDRYRQRIQSSTRRPGDSLSVFCIEEPMMAGTNQLRALRFEVNRTIQVRAILIKRHKLFRREPQQDARVVFRGVTK
jgi:hypothetical protein